MSDLISRQVAIDAIEQHKTAVLGEREWDEGIAYGYAAAHRHIVEIVKALPSAQPEQRWIPCSERLPDEDYCTGANHQYSADVLITAHNADDEETIIDYGHTIDGEWYSDTTDCIVPSEWKVLAWMPLPDPYGGEKDG